MSHLYELIQKNVDTWRGAGYHCADYPAIAEILEYAILPETGSLRFLRAAQLRALETYWYLRLVEGTPHIFDLYPSSVLLDCLEPSRTLDSDRFRYGTCALIQPGTKNTAPIA